MDLPLKVRKTKHVMVLEDYIRVHDYLKPICSRDENGFSVYLRGWSDRRVAENMGNGISETNVRFVRCRMIGKSRAPSASGTDRMSELERRVEWLESIAEKLGEKHP